MVCRVGSAVVRALKKSTRTKLSEDHDSGKLKSTHIHDVAGRNGIFSRHV